MMQAKPQKEHVWLQKMVGEWVGEMDGSDDPSTPAHPPWRETVRTLGDLWVVGEGLGAMEDGTPSSSMVTLGFDPDQQRFVGSWVGSSMANMWIYSGVLDEAGEVLTLDTEGPSFSGEPGLQRYQDVVSFEGEDRILTSRVQKPDGSWEEFMRLRYRRQP